MLRLTSIEFKKGSILLYVLWILVVISVLAFKFSASTRVVLLKDTSQVARMKRDMQLASIVKYAAFQIYNDNWENKKIELILNDEKILIEIFNETGFLTIYDLSSQSLKNVFEIVNIDISELDDLKSEIDDRKLRFNDFFELTRFEGVSIESIVKVIPYISIYHQDPVNPEYSPAEVLMKLDGVDKFRVSKLIESSDEKEIADLRSEIIDGLRTREVLFGNKSSSYFRVNAVLGSKTYRLFLKIDLRSQKYIVVNTIYPEY